MFFVSLSGICSMQRSLIRGYCQTLLHYNGYFPIEANRDHILLCNKMLGFQKVGLGDSKSFGMWMYLFICLCQGCSVFARYVHTLLFVP